MDERDCIKNVIHNGIFSVHDRLLGRNISKPTKDLLIWFCDELEKKLCNDIRKVKYRLNKLDIDIPFDEHQLRRHSQSDSLIEYRSLGELGKVNEESSSEEEFETCSNTPVELSDEETKTS